jgi:hypothetical protein
MLLRGTGQGYDDMQRFEPGKFVKELMEWFWMIILGSSCSL